MNNFFVTSSGTEIGKTLVTAALTWQLRRTGQSVHAIKPVISGVTDTTMAGSDTEIIGEAMGLASGSDTWDRISPMRYLAPLAPSMAAALEGRSLDYNALLSVCRDAMSLPGITLIEGVGGSFVPLVDDKLVCDWITFKIQYSTSIAHRFAKPCST